MTDLLHPDPMVRWVHQPFRRWVPEGDSDCEDNLHTDTVLPDRWVREWVGPGDLHIDIYIYIYIY